MSSFLLSIFCNQGGNGTSFSGDYVKPYKPAGTIMSLNKLLMKRYS